VNMHTVFLVEHLHTQSKDLLHQHNHQLVSADQCFLDNSHNPVVYLRLPRPMNTLHGEGGPSVASF